MADHELSGKQQNRLRPAPKHAPASAPKEEVRTQEPTGVLLQRALAAPTTLRPSEGRRLQGVLGNRGMAQLARAKAGRVVQAKLTVGAAHDPFEQEADRMADRVADSVLSAQSQAHSQSPIQRLPAAAQREPQRDGGGFEAGTAFESQLARTQGGGQPLPSALRAQVEPAYGAGFENVRVHAGSDAATLADSIQAKAFTHGNDIHFNAGEYNPDTSVGQRLIAHELTHVVQQGAATQQPVQRAHTGAEAQVAVQRSPSGVIQREGKRVNSLIAFWESQKKLNAPTKPQPEAQGAPKQPEPEPAVGGNVALLEDAVAPPEGDLSKSNPAASVSGRADTPNFAVLHTPNVVSHLSFSTQQTMSSSDWSSSIVSASASAPPQPVAARPLGMQFPGQTRYKDRLQVGSEYGSESSNSTNFLMTKVFQKTSESAFWAIPEANRIQGLKSIGWTDQDIADLETSKSSKVKYLSTEEERADYQLHLGATITQGALPDPFDTSAMFAMGVGQGHAIFVMDPNGTFYAGRHKVAAFHHSSFLAGGDAASAGTLEIKDGKLKSITGKSGHYIPKDRQVRLALAELRDQGVSLSNVKVQTISPSFQLNPQEPADWFLNQGITPDPQSALMSTGNSTYSSTSQSYQSSSGSQPFAAGGSGTPAPVSDFSPKEIAELEAVGGSDWKEKLEAKGFSGNGRWWSPASGMGGNVSDWDLIDVLKGLKTVQDFEW